MKGLFANHDVGIQLLLPDGFANDQEAARRMRHVAACGFTVVELNILEPERVDPPRLKDWLASFGLRMTVFASGAAAKAMNLSLTHTDEALRQVTVHRVQRFIDFAKAMDAAVVFGFIKGGPAATRAPLIRSLKELATYAEDAGAKMILEATNRYETGVCNSVEQTLSVLDEVGSPSLKMLADTYHMNIEERDMLGAFDACLDRSLSVHLSDNNRFLPGRGAIDFGPIVRHIIGRGFKGVFALEGNIPSFDQDVRDSAACLEALK
jgi:sugar phosphate isomerase/epimerase